jgi:hypothetical protein
MKTIVEVSEKEGLEGLLGGRIAVWCCNYIYSGILSGVSDSEIKLTDASVVYETGSLGEKQFKLSEKLPSDWYIRTSAIESYGVMQPQQHQTA